MSLKRTLVRNIVSNWTGFAVQAVVAFLLTPYVLGQLGQEAYGIWTLVIGLTGYYGLLDVGFRAGLTQYLARYLARRDFEQMNGTASTGMAALALASGLLITVSGLLALLAPRLFQISPRLVSDVRACILIIGLATALQFLFFVFSAVLSATQRYDVSNAIGVSTRLLSATASYLVLRQGYGLVGISLAVGSVNLIDYLLRCWAAYRVLPELHLSPRRVNWSSAGALMNFGVWNIAIAGSRRIISYTDAIVIGFFLPAAAITPFALAVSLADHLHNVFRPLGPVFFPAFTQADARGDREAMRKMYLYGTKLMSLLPASAAVVAALFAGDFYRLWVGPELVDHGKFGSVTRLFWMLLASVTVSSMQTIGYQVLMSTGRLRLLAILFFSEAIANLAISAILILPLGLMGVAIGTLVPALVFHALLQPIACLRALEIPWREYLRFCVMPVLLVLAVQVPISWWLRRHYDASTWWSLGLGGVWAGAIALAAVGTLGLDANERRRFLFDPLARLTMRVRGRLRGTETEQPPAPRGMGGDPLG